jgi:luciferase-like monooxygenase
MSISRRRTIHDAIVEEVASWPGVTTGRHPFGGTEFRFGRRELGHLHQDRLADLPFPLLVRDDLVAACRVEPHHIHPESGWVSYFIRDETDVARVIALFRMNYDRPWTKRDAGPR